MPDSHILIRFTLGIQKRDYSRVHPVDAAVLGTIAEFAFPDLARGDPGPQIAYEFFWVITELMMRWS